MRAHLLRSRLVLLLVLASLTVACASVSTLPDEIANNPDRPPSGSDVSCLDDESFDECAVRLGIYLYANQNEQSCADGLTDQDCRDRFRVIMQRRDEAPAATPTPVRDPAVADWLHNEFERIGVMPDRTHAACLAERGIDPLAASPPVAMASEQAALSVGLLVCSADELGASIELTEAIPDGYTRRDIACVTAQRFRALGDFDPEEAIELVQNPGTDGALRDAVIPKAVVACGLAPDDVASLFVFTR